MPLKHSYLTSTHAFCGAGGSSQGCHAAGVEVSIALNHWARAIETHSTNFPNALHDCTDISACDPRRYPSTDFWIGSPECDTHSPAGGNRHKQVNAQLSLYETGKINPATERSRATMWDVCRFSEYHNYNMVIVENVVEAKTRWQLFDVWLSAMHKLGYMHECLYLNSMHFHPTPQSRDRLYVVFWKKGNKAPDLNYTPNAYCTKCAKDVDAVQVWKNPRIKYGKYKKQYVYCCPADGTVVEPYYYAAANVIDWSDLGTKIGDRKKPLAANTIHRINLGLKRYSAQPFVVKMEQSSQKDSMVKSAYDVLQTQLSRQTSNIVTPPFLVEMKGTSTARSINEAISCITSKTYHGIISNDSWNSFIASSYKTPTLTHISNAIGTCTSIDRHSLVAYQTPNIEDCYFRTIRPTEVKKATAFEDSYVICGNGREQVEQLGNAVTPPPMTWITRKTVETLN